MKSRIKIPNVDISKFKIRGINVQVSNDYKTDSQVITTIINVQDVVTGQDSRIFRRLIVNNLAFLEWNDRNLLHGYIKQEIIGAILHEIDECLFIDGQRVTEPIHESRRRV
jgi:hypothetical protein